jgi:hypothetical protein
VVQFPVETSDFFLLSGAQLVSYSKVIRGLPPRPLVGRDSRVGIATRYGTDGPGSNPGGGGLRLDFPHPSRPALGPTQPPIQGVKRPGRGVDHPPHQAPRLSKE